MLSPELKGALDALVGNQHKSESAGERATWALLLEEYSDDEILAAVEGVHDESDAPLLAESKEYELPA